MTPSPLNQPEPDDADQGPSRHWTAAVGLVAVGGTLGTGARVLLSRVIPPVAGAPAGIFLINMTGSFLLGLLLEVLTRSGPDTGPRQRLRLLLGSGVLGGYTTYSAFAVDTASLITSSHLSTATAYPVLSILGGVALAQLGIMAGSALPSPLRAGRKHR